MAVVGNALTDTVTSSVEEAHTPLLTVHLSTLLEPTVKPVNPLVALPAVVTDALPEVTVQAPVPTVGVLPAKVAVVMLHKPWSVPALEVVGRASIWMLTSSVETAQNPLLIVHRKTVVAPTVKPVTVELGSFAELMLPLPLTTVHVPVPTVGVLPDKVVLVTLHKV